MAAPREADSNAKKRTDEALDVSSLAFDPLRALYSRRVQLPYPNIAPLNNIAEYESYSKGKTIKQRRAAEGGDGIQQKTDASVNTKTQIKQRKNPTNDSSSLCAAETGAGKDIKKGKDDGKRKLHKTRRNVLTRMEAYTKGPLSVLQRCVSERLLVQVWIRSAVDLRGMCKGYLVAFDKHFNLAMIDVDELYRCPKWKETQQQKENKRERKRAKQLREQMALMSITSTEVCSETEKSEERQLSSKDILSTSSRECQKTEVEASSESHLGASNENEQNKDDAQNKSSQTLEKVKPDGKDPSAILTSASEEVEAACSKSTSAESNNTPPPTTTPSCKFIERHVNQLFIRGDNVVSVVLLE
uniref:U7 snRNA-associated Sm-like protein LSm11 n=1 Tax=Crassostrea virginica TaxID=6565 RepID=A0A8B8CR69_CRAVI|nr:U7 snRNA-associated Sm-like protein LSm11 [Crassostrea virginica]